MKLKWHPEALDEYERAGHYYQAEEEGLEDRFVGSVEAAIESIVSSS